MEITTDKPVQPLKTYVNKRKILAQVSSKPESNVLLKREPLTTKKAVELFLSGTLKNRVCRFCLHTAFPLSELDQLMHIAGRGALYSIKIRDIVASFYPFQVVDDSIFPSNICNKCLNQAIRSYLFAQQCEQAERAIRNCFEDIFDKIEKLDPLEKVKKRGRQKLNPNYNTLYTDHTKVMDYAEPIMHLINSGSTSLTKEPQMSDLECKKCWQVLPNIESLINHEKKHPKTMWYNCRICGKSFVKCIQLKRHLRIHNSKDISLVTSEASDFICKQCDFVSENYLLHLQHIEKHKFQMVFEHLVEKKMDKLCVVCMDKGNLQALDKVISLHGGYPELTGDRSIINILGSTIPEMNIIHNYTGTKICENCLSSAISSYIFINRTHYIRHRLDNCISKMLDNLNALVEPENKIFIEIAANSIVPVLEYDDIEDLLINEEEIDEDRLKVDVLEDEFRLKSESENSDDENVSPNELVKDRDSKRYSTLDIAANADKMKLVNGYQSFNFENVCSEFLTFKKKRKHRKVTKCKFTCHICNKHFISDYFLKTHVLKHVNRKVECKICNIKFRSKFHLNEHVKIKHLKNEGVYESCQFCGRIFTDENNLIKHQKCHLRKQCQLCSKIFMTQAYFDSHMQRHAMKWKVMKRENVQTCSFCEKEYVDDNELSIHVNKIHLQIKPYGCDMCDRQFYTNKILKSHQQIHSLTKKETCEFCGKTLRCRKDLVIHIRKHIGAKPFRCLVCSQLFYSESEMKRHMKKWHAGSFCCRMCKKVFVNRKELDYHINSVHAHQWFYE